MLDRMRETLFNILQFEMEGVVFADLYAGTGAVGIEALSRGAKQALFVEQNRAAARGALREDRQTHQANVRGGNTRRGAELVGRQRSANSLALWSGGL